MAGTPTLTTGDPITFVVGLTVAGTPVDFSATPAWLSFVANGKARLVLQYVPGGPDNQGTLFTAGGRTYLRFTLTAAQTRAGVLPPATYAVRLRCGSADGADGFGGHVYRQLRVKPYEDGLPFAPPVAP